MKIKTYFLKTILFFLVLIVNSACADKLPEKPIVVLITSFKNAKWYKRNLDSVFRQKYSNYRVIYIDDMSPDGTADLVEAHVKNAKQEHRFTLVRNEERRLALGNIVEGVHRCDDHEIIVSLDGDDWFKDDNDNVLAIINESYSLNNVWLTHGTLIEYPCETVGWSIPIPDEIVEKNEFRKYRCPSHLRTFYAWLFKKIDEEDLKYDGKYFQMTWDMAMMFPMIEMAGERHAFIEDIIYEYNMETSLNDNKVNAQMQQYYDMWIRAMPPYERLDESEVPLLEQD
jgi:glycosyltransferase involved in cell wall biosynthesis